MSTTSSALERNDRDRCHDRAYRELETVGVVSTAGRHGTVVSRGHRVSASDRQSRLRDAADTFVRLARQLGAADADALEALNRAGLADERGG